jgi:outer membrane protein assembly factor BamB
MKKNHRSFVLAFVFLIVFILFNACSNSPAGHTFLATATLVTYANIPLYGPGEMPFYNPTGDSDFVPVINFKGVTTWRYNWTEELAANPFLVSGDHLLFAGYVQEPDDESPIHHDFYESNNELLCIDINSGQILWQDWIGGAHIVMGENHVVYVPATSDFVPPGLMAYDAASGKKLWETRLPDDCCEVETFYPVGSEIHVTVHIGHGYYSSYVLDRETGGIKQSFEREKRYKGSDGVASDGIILKRYYLGYGSVKAFSPGTGNQLWAIDEPVVSNIAVDDSTAYFVTMNTELIAVNIPTGEILGRLSFTPEFDPGFDYYDPNYRSSFDFLNEAPTVAADNNYIVVYFEDKKQLSVFRFLDRQ